jgi:hypothetical protein
LLITRPIETFLIAVALLVAPDSCGNLPDGPRGVGDEACRAAFQAAAAVDETADTVTDLDPAIPACFSLEQWSEASEAYPAALDGADPQEFLRNRCLDAHLATIALCRTLE